MSKTIVILGASYAGLLVAHKLLKHTLPVVKDFKVVLVSPSTHIYGNLASVRAIIPGQFSDEKLWIEIAPGFKSYPSGAYSFILGKASAVDPSSKSVTITQNDGQEVQQSYDILVVATGSRVADGMPWKNEGSYEHGKETLHGMQKRVQAAKSIVIGGAGPTGVETAGELGFEYGKVKDITLITSGDHVLVGSLPAAHAASVERQLEKMGVKIIKSTRVTSSSTTSDGHTDLGLSNGTTLTTDVYLPTVGVIPNTEFMPSNLLNDKGELIMDNYLRVKNADSIWAAGDVIDLQRSQVMLTEAQGKALAKNLDLHLKGKDLVWYKTDGSPTLAVTMGRSKATGISGSMKIPGVVLWWFKGRKMGTDMLPKYVTGAGM
ncbi:hypothetical protein BP5796_01347 [Coleophoma crateriformis]|uniref:FAD/NAD(P)-binding domain-containing protein n=1 Tax=Coleophoma crateriformis TaxID=565419 RepID=A0A3D8T058_9HELO|nr:hypothetical protein BP5796_01347 [Coleophoma crateriformis]